ncbi:hypothetical protein A2334_05560 [Candidatus Roizmanbacteria bacterium RIFOXYB2_FULL_38_10]|uniref:Methyltransferase type 11 domain-containing protein n=1 Tax=Candidatus Roizmanbacteria bacterium RIFOXYD1_FULL_38_12 TaxID=1802093 RepID=A0A1F7L0K6_9BACT|nr:MAG: hypothetical protein A3K47_02680 [Candidatus Roizmanbacteria bacterium RIFOXYA2_FULL_38_14]OGK63674.1 MAG: hypothetical protein A3K27_02680 [Candidatus Roizmanbacteria bacterium RIFOXYA1_FULL_37_12]OGK65520.1 MAG: hypothetical protein A3K38_02680 [Candidatus Roizmanbacteria bacterium RIFOXYB1_FULL_40_23]OGK68304.1 MAG: hypothetical protein A2334_05560 [Candidatus Roizmanbacteria bacterium RIFOXYB2_FULL_38_10]OGK69925.1 MAG: hypothetical protein A3K21_02685 [Candidatus Roizmanbacteria ba
MGSDNIDKKTKIIADLERIIPDKIPPYSKRLLQEHVLRYQFVSKYIKGKTVLDVACGSGYGSYIIANSGAKKVYAADCDSKTISYAKKRYPHDNINYICTDAAKLSVANCLIDVVVSFETIEHLSKPKLFLKEMYRLLKRTGICIISTPNKHCSLEDNPYHLKEYTFSEFTNILEQYFPGKKYYFGQRKVIKPIISFYLFLKRYLPSVFLPLLRIRPWEKLNIIKINKKATHDYLYFIAVCYKN